MACGREQARGETQRDRMEQITKAEGGGYYYGNEFCHTAEEAYERFRTEYNAAMGKQFYKRLNRLGQRKERVHTFGFVFAEGLEPDAGEFTGLSKTKTRLLGFSDISLARVLGCWDAPNFDDEKYERWFDWAFSRNSGGLKLVGLRQKHGRTNKKLRKRYR